MISVEWPEDNNVDWMAVARNFEKVVSSKDAEIARLKFICDRNRGLQDDLTSLSVDNARLQEQVETLRKERDEARFGYNHQSELKSVAIARAETAETERDRLREALEAERAAMDATHRRAMAAEDRVTILNSALREACDQILDSYRTWVADDCSAHPRPGQIPRYDRSLAALQKEPRP